MKKFLSLIVGLIFSLSAYSQYSQAKIDYPKFETDSNGQQVLVMTIEQAQSLDNSTDLLALLEKQSTQIGQYDSVCVRVINDKEQVIASQKMEIAKLKESLNNKDQQIKALQGEVAAYLKKILILEEQVANRQQVIDEKNLQIRKMKTKMIFGGVGGGVAIIGLILGLVVLH
jgi:chromosome segregation ATPase